jgi:hypothetical protein
MVSEAQILVNRRLMCSIIPAFHHSIHGPCTAGSGGLIVQNKANFPPAQVNRNSFAERGL